MNKKLLAALLASLGLGLSSQASAVVVGGVDFGVKVDPQLDVRRK